MGLGGEGQVGSWLRLGGNVDEGRKILEQMGRGQDVRGMGTRRGVHSALPASTRHNRDGDAHTCTDCSSQPGVMN